jgi:hypothetical protein
MRQLILILTALVFLAPSCNKEHLPEYYFKCKVDGKEYVPDNCANCRTADLLGDTVIILGGNRYVESIAVTALEYPLQQKSYSLLSKTTKGRGAAFYDKTIGNPSDIFRTDSLSTGQLTITTLDKTNKIIAGTFYFEAYNAVQNKTVSITEGKFRLQYQPF